MKSLGGKWHALRELAMKAIEIWRNGQRLATAGLRDGFVTATLSIRNQVDPMWFDARGRDASTGGHVDWLHEAVRVGDEFVLRLVDVDEQQSAEPVATVDPRFLGDS